MADFYVILGVPRNATREEIRAAYLKQIKRSHPDVCHSRRADDACDVNCAYETLSDPAERARYDREKRSERAPTRSAAMMATLCGLVGICGIGLIAIWIVKSTADKASASKHLPTAGFADAGAQKLPRHDPQQMPTLRELFDDYEPQRNRRIVIGGLSAPVTIGPSAISTLPLTVATTLPPLLPERLATAVEGTGAVGEAATASPAPLVPLNPLLRSVPAIEASKTSAAPRVVRREVDDDDEPEFVPRKPKAVAAEPNKPVAVARRGSRWPSADEPFYEPGASR